MRTVYSLEAAREWFLSNASGTVRCQRGGDTDDNKECSSFPEAERFYNQETEESETRSEDDSTDMGSVALGTIAAMESMTSSDPTPSDPDPSSDFASGGGESGGGGASSDF